MPPRPMPVADALATVVAAPRGLLGLGMPGCSACMLLPTSFAELHDARPGLVVAIGEFTDPADWAERERLLWPRGIHVSRSSVPALALLEEGEVVATRPGGGPATAIDRWIASHWGPAEHPLPDSPTARELAALDALSLHIAGQRREKHGSGRLA